MQENRFLKERKKMKEAKSVEAIQTTVQRDTHMQRQCTHRVKSNNNNVFILLASLFSCNRRSMLFVASNRCFFFFFVFSHFPFRFIFFITAAFYSYAHNTHTDMNFIWFCSKNFLLFWAYSLIHRHTQAQHTTYLLYVRFFLYSGECRKCEYIQQQRFAFFGSFIERHTTHIHSQKRMNKFYRNYRFHIFAYMLIGFDVG